MENRQPLFEQFAALPAEVCTHAFTRRVPDIDVSYDKGEVLARLDSVHGEIRDSLGLGERAFVTATQVHGNSIATVASAQEQCFGGCDGLITNRSDVCLGVYVADCCAVYLVDPVRRAIGLVHSGKKGTELGIVREAITRMREEFATEPHELLIQLSPCIRPPHYEIDFAAEIVRQCRVAGVEQVHDCGICTACDLERYYSYRAEKGRTGRMLALLAIR